MNCRKSLGLRDGSFFEKSNLSLKQWVVLMYWWVRQYPVGDAAQEAEIGKKSAIQTYQYLRDICSWRIVNVDSPLMLGRPGVINESLFRHKPKYHRGRPAAQEVWVFGMVNTSQSPALGVRITVPEHKHSSPSCNGICTIVHSDQWRAYNRVQQLPSVTQHATVNHSLNFVDPTNGTHTQNVESYWNRVKTKFKRMKGVHESMLGSYMDEFMWRERHGTGASTTFASLCRDLSLRYPQ